MKRFGIIGDPVAHSLSPRLFAAAYHGRYPYDLIEGSDFGASWERFLRDYDGINVTAPFKEKACRAVDILSPEAERIGAVNLVVKKDGRTVGYNSDCDGVRLTLEEAGLSAPLKALVIGCGGAGKAAAAAAADLGHSLLLVNRTFGKAEALAGRLGGKALPLTQIREAVRAADLILYTLPTALDEMGELSGKTLLEANYRNPVFSEGGAYRYISGRRWLLHQAAAGYIRFTGEAPDIGALSAI